MDLHLVSIPRLRTLTTRLERSISKHVVNGDVEGPDSFTRGDLQLLRGQTDGRLHA